jgi:hypothetical protein
MGVLDGGDATVNSLGWMTCAVRQRCTTGCSQPPSVPDLGGPASAAAMACGSKPDDGRWRPDLGDNGRGCAHGWVPRSTEDGEGEVEERGGGGRVERSVVAGGGSGSHESPRLTAYVQGLRV